MTVKAVKSSVKGGLNVALKVVKEGKMQCYRLAQCGGKGDKIQR